MAAIIFKPTPQVQGRVDITRSFSYKLNTGSYESRDFFCSQHAECEASEADEIADLLYQFCKRQVLKAVREYQLETESKFAPQARRTA